SFFLLTSFLLILPPPPSLLSPYTTLFRSVILQPPIGLSLIIELLLSTTIGPALCSSLASPGVSIRAMTSAVAPDFQGGQRRSERRVTPAIGVLGLFADVSDSLDSSRRSSPGWAASSEP